MKIYGHRGASFSTPENTRSSLIEAFNLGAEGAEFDLQMTKDREIILLHDETFERTAGAYYAHLFPKMNFEEYQGLIKTPVSQLDLKTCRSVDVGQWKGLKWKGEKIITLAEALAILSPGKEYLVEIKGDDFAIIPLLQEVLTQSQVPASSLKLIGFGLEVMKEVKRVLPQFMAFYILEGGQMSSPPVFEEEMNKALKAGLDGLDLEATSHVTRERVDFLHAKGMKVIVWVSGKALIQDSADNAQRMEEAGVDIFTSNLPPEVMNWKSVQNRK